MTVSPAYVVASTIGPEGHSHVMPHYSFRQVLCKPSFRSCYFQKEGDVTVPLGALLAAEAWHQLLPCGQHGRHVFTRSCWNKSLNQHACTISWCQKWDFLRVTVQDSNFKLLHIQTTLQEQLVYKSTIPSIEWQFKIQISSFFTFK